MRKRSVLSKGLLSAPSSDCFQWLVAFPAMFLDPQAINCWGFLREILKSSTPPAPHPETCNVTATPFSSSEKKHVAPYSSVNRANTQLRRQTLAPGGHSALFASMFSVFPLKQIPCLRGFSVPNRKRAKGRGESKVDRELGGRRASPALELGPETGSLGDAHAPLVLAQGRKATEVKHQDVRPFQGRT